MSIPLIQPTYTVTIGSFSITQNELDMDIRVYMNTSFEPDFFKILLYNVNDIVQAFIVNGAEIVINIGYDSKLSNNILTGVITNVSNQDSQSENIKCIEGIDGVIYKLKNTPINLSINTKIDVIEIIRQVCSQAGVVLSPIVIPSGIMLENYTIENEIAYDVVKKLAKRIDHSITSKASMLFVTPTINNNVISAIITEEAGFKLTEVKAITQDGKYKTSGYNFYGAGVPTMLPMSLVTVAMIEDQIYGTYIVESITHDFKCKGGYLVSGTLVEVTAESKGKLSIQEPTSKSIASIISDKISEEIALNRSLETGIVEQVFSDKQLLTAKFGVSKDKIKASIVPSVESDYIGENNVFLNKKPISSLFAGDGYGVIVPIYKDARSVIGFNRNDMQDANIIGFLFKNGWKIPAHDVGEFLLKMKNHSKISLKEDAHGIIQLKGLKIEIGSNGLTESKTSKTDDGKILITFDDGSELSFKQGDGWKMKTSGNVLIEGSAIKIGEGASQGAARVNDPILLDTALKTWMNTHTHPTAAVGPPSPPTVGYTGTDAGTVKQGSTKTKIE